MERVNPDNSVDQKIILRIEGEENGKDYAFTSSCDCLIVGNRFEEPIFRKAYHGKYQFRFLGKANTDILFDKTSV